MEEEEEEEASSGCGWRCWNAHTGKAVELQKLPNLAEVALAEVALAEDTTAELI